MGSYAGIGFVIPSDNMKHAIHENNPRRPIRGYLSSSIMNDRQKQTIFSSIKSLQKIDGVLEHP